MESRVVPHVRKGHQRKTFECNYLCTDFVWTSVVFVLCLLYSYFNESCWWQLSCLPACWAETNGSMCHGGQSWFLEVSLWHLFMAILVAVQNYTSIILKQITVVLHYKLEHEEEKLKAFLPDKIKKRKWCSSQTTSPPVYSLLLHYWSLHLYDVATCCSVCFWICENENCLCTCDSVTPVFSKTHMS